MGKGKKSEWKKSEEVVGSGWNTQKRKMWRNGWDSVKYNVTLNVIAITQYNKRTRNNM